MSEPILATKLYIPPAQTKVVARPRLIERLDEGLHRKLTLISAPAGFGKTTLVREWIAGSERLAAWLSLDREESGPTRFLTYLVSAVQVVEPSTGSSVLRALQSPQPPPVGSVLTVLLNEVSAVPDRFLLVLDDYHAIDSELVDAALAFMIERLPQQMHLVVVTREDPRLPLARLRARGEMTELRVADLRFTQPETADFLNRTMSLDLSEDDVAALEARTEGWIAGLQLAAISMQGREDVQGFIQNFAGDNRYIVDYLVEEVLKRQPEQTRRFLLQTSVLDRLSGPLSDAITGRTDGNEMLETLERGNVFVLPLDDKRHWYRYHHLFADVLRAHAVEEEPDQLPVWHRRASEWHERQGLPSHAIRHALAAGAFERAADLVERAGRAMLTGRQDDMFLGWLKALPDEVIRTRPVLSVYYALAVVSVDPKAAEARLRDAEQLLDMAAHLNEQPEARSIENSPEQSRRMVIVDEEGFRSLPGTIAIVRAYHAGARGDVLDIIEHARRALELLPEGDYLWRGAAGGLLGLAYWTSGDLEAAYRSFADAWVRLQMTGDFTQSTSGAFVLANIRVAQGRLREATRIYEQALERAAGLGNPTPPPIVDLYVGMSELCYEHGDLEAASRYLQRCQELGKHGGISEHRHRWYVAMARIQEGQGDLDRALDLLDEAERLYVRSPAPDMRPIAAMKARGLLRHGRVAEALGWVLERGLSVDDDLSYLHEFEHITLARLLIARYRTDRSASSIHDALALLGRLREAAEHGGRIGSLIEILALQVLAHEAQGDVPRALASLKRALTLAEPEGYVRIFVDEGHAIRTLLRQAAVAGIANSYTQRLLSAFDEPAQSASTPVRTPASLAEPLTGRESEILRLIATGMRNQEIADRLSISLSTVKRHIANAYGKLGVSHRTEAVARANELNLL